MLQQAQERVIQRAAHELTMAELPLGVETDRYARMRTELLFVSRAKIVQMDWGDVLPDPEVSFAFLERLMVLSPAIGRIARRATVDEVQGCWALPLKMEYDDQGTGRYPSCYDRKQKTNIVAHRYVWQTLIDPDIETNQWVDHLCRVHACCNPTHLEAVTPGTNTKRGNDARHILGGQDPLFHPE